jgi:hypothetical protein
MRKLLYKNEDGVTLLMSVMMMSGIAIITSTVAFFVVQEIRNSRSSALTEPAIIAAEAASEQGIFRVKRLNSTTPLTSCATAGYTLTDGTTAVTADNASGTIIKKCEASSSAAFQFTEENPLEVFFYDVNNINGNLCMEQTCSTSATADIGGTGAQIYSSIIVKYVSGTGNLPVELETLDGVSSGIIGPAILDVGQSGTYTIPINIIGSLDERLKLSIQPTSGSATVEISTTGSATGVPDFQTLNAEACVGFGSITNCDSSTESYKRRINVTIPR